jgi:hypothetical protein
MDDKAFQSGGVAGKGMGFVKNARDKDPGHDPHLPPDKLSAVFYRPASIVALHHWLWKFFWAPWRAGELIC